MQLIGWFSSARLRTAVGRVWIVAAFSVGGAACNGSPAFESDPSYWNPLSTDPDGAFDPQGDGGVVVDPACLTDPAFDASIVVSSPGAISHRSGQPCLEGCHEAGGEARSAFAVGGTVFRSQTSRVVAEGGFVANVGGTRLEVDACGNVYAKESELLTKLSSTNPNVSTPTYRRMDRTLSRVERPGSCNQSGCHDFSSKRRWGIYF
jgi:hypothetical protein